MSQVRLFIARHGETDYNKKGLLQGRGIDAPLNETGKLQAKKLSDYLKSYDINGVFCSNLQRTWQTAKPYRELSGIEIIKDKNLDEMDFGDFEGVSYSEISEEINRVQQSWQKGDTSVNIPGGESPDQVFERANDAVQTIISNHIGDTLTLIIHGRLIRILLSEWLGYGLKNMHKIDHTNGGVNQIVFNKNSFTSVYLNKTAHLADLEKSVLNG